MVRDYYADRLSADRLARVYEIAPPRIRQYLDAEAAYAASKISPGGRVLELGCGYGRALRRLAARGGLTIGIDTSESSLRMGTRVLRTVRNCYLIAMDARRLGFRDDTFDVVACVQNGISAFHVDPRLLVAEAYRVTRPGGLMLFSTYSDKFWDQRLRWFHLQSKAGLVGEIDESRTGNGVIACRDGFTGTAFSPDQLMSFTSGLDVDARITEVDESSLFLEMTRL